MFDLLLVMKKLGPFKELFSWIFHKSRKDAYSIGKLASTSQLAPIIMTTHNPKPGFAFYKPQLYIYNLKYGLIIP